MTVNRHFLRELLGVGLLGLVAFFAYRGLAGTLYRSQSIAPHFVTLANAFRHGQTTLPHEGYDLILYEGQWYVAQPPLPALLLIPVVAIFGAGFSDILASLGLGALGVIACYGVLRDTLPTLDTPRRWLLTLAFSFGTVYASLVPMGTVWFLGQVVAVICLWGYIAALQRRWYWVAGLCLGGILLSRPFMIFGAGVYALLMLLPPTLALRPAIAHLYQEQRLTLVKIGVGLVMAGVFMGGYNMVRFGSPLEFGYQYIQDAPNIRAKREAHGIFSPVFFPENLYVATIKPIDIHLNCLTSDDCGVLAPDLAGAGILWTSPFLLYLFLARPRQAKETQHLRALAVASILCLLPPLFYHNTGSAQFGYRFLLDALPFMLMLVAYGSRRGPLWLLVALILFSMAVNVWGARWFVHTIYGI